MKIDQFLRHHGIAGNPFSEEDAQTDTVFKRQCLATIHHPAWDKFFGSPADPSTALVFGEKGSGTPFATEQEVRKRFTTAFEIAEVRPGAPFRKQTWYRLLRKQAD